MVEYLFVPIDAVRSNCSGCCFRTVLWDTSCRYLVQIDVIVVNRRQLSAERKLW